MVVAIPLGGPDPVYDGAGEGLHLVTDPNQRFAISVIDKLVEARRLELAERSLEPEPEPEARIRARRGVIAHSMKERLSRAFLRGQGSGDDGVNAPDELSDAALVDQLVDQSRRDADERNARDRERRKRVRLMREARGERLSGPRGRGR
jgi:hypothetical protein